MEIALLMAAGLLFSWLSLVILIAIGQNIADLSVPPWPETLWKLAVIAIIPEIIILSVPLHAILVNLIVMVVFWTLMVKWFQVDFLGAVILVVLSWFIRLAMLAALSGVIHSIS